MGWIEDILYMKPDKKFVKLLRALDDIHKSGIALLDVSPSNIMKCNGELKFIDLGFAALYLYEDMPTIRFGCKTFQSPWAHIASKLLKLQSKKQQELHLEKKLLLEAIANDYWSLAFIFARKLCNFDENMIFTAHIKEIIGSKFSKYGRYAKYSVAEINEFLQNYLDHLFSEVRITVNHFSSCGKPLQEILKSVLQVNPIIRMQNVEKILSTY